MAYDVVTQYRIAPTDVKRIIKMRVELHPLLSGGKIET